MKCGDLTRYRAFRATVSRKGAKAGQILQARLCVFAIFAPFVNFFFLSRTLQIGSELGPGCFAHQGGLCFPFHCTTQLDEEVSLA